MDHATINRQKKSLAMVAVIDANALRQNVSPFDQAGRILLASLGWSDAVWHQIALDAGYPSKVPPRDTTREMIRVIYRGRAAAPVQRKAS
jgi:hypothetical protein